MGRNYVWRSSSMYGSPRCSYLQRYLQYSTWNRKQLFTNIANIVDESKNIISGQGVINCTLQWITKRKSNKNFQADLMMRYSSLFIMWYPNLVFTTGEICPFWRAKAASSNSFTIFPLPKVPRSPPRFFEGQSETSLAIFANFSPFSNRSRTPFASFSVFTRMWAQWTLFGIKTD